MKKLLLFIAASAFSVAVVNAQTDTTKTTTKTTTSTQQSVTPAYPTKDMKKVSASEIPANLRTTLQGSEYKGWENSTIYYNSTTGQYSYQAPSTTGSTSATGTKGAQWYHFDKSGKRITDNKPQ